MRILNVAALILFLSGKISVVNAQEVVSQAWIDSDRLTVEFAQAVEVQNARGFRLVGGVARIHSLLSGQGTRRLTFLLTDHALPDDRFSLLYWAELGDLRQKSTLLPGWEVVVENRANRYGGAGKLYYVSTAGRDAYAGTDSLQPLRTVRQAQQLAEPGDYILLRRGDIFRNSAIRVLKSGQPGKPLTFAAYGRGPQPLLTHGEEDIVTITDQDYVQIDNWHLQVRGDGKKGVYLSGDSRHPVISNCRVEGFGKPLYGINFGKNDGEFKRVVNPRVLNNHVTGFMVNIISTGYPYDGSHEVAGGLIENNRSGKTRSIKNGDGIDAQRGRFHGLVIRKNEIFGYYDDGIDVYGADSVIIEYNQVHRPQQPSDSGQGIKAGGLTRDEKINGHQSTNIIVRYNTVHSLYNKMNNTGSQNGINANDGASGHIYGNLVYDVQGHGIVISGPIQRWEVHHNVVMNAGESAINVWTEGDYDNQVSIVSNILEGSKSDIKATTRTTGKTIVGRENQLVQQKTVGAYRSASDRTVNPSAVLKVPGRPDLGLKPAYYRFLSTEMSTKPKRE